MASDGWLAAQNVNQVWLSADPNAHNEQVPAQAFFRACVTLSTIFDLLTGMSVAKNAMMDNLKKSAAHFSTSDEELTVQQGIGEEAERLGGTAAMADQASLIHQLTWLLRGVAFVRGIVHEMIDHPEATMTTCVRSGYNSSLKIHHPMAVQSMVWLLAKAAPNRAKFEALLGTQGLAEQLSKLVPVVDRVVNSVQGALDVATR
tara:strand:- start:3473 stop:4081 length:609 start_codon:yes stop_codon:yes gene_type:complete